jgi:hypothetical protein
LVAVVAVARTEAVVAVAVALCRVRVLFCRRLTQLRLEAAVLLACRSIIPVALGRRARFSASLPLGAGEETRLEQAVEHPVTVLQGRPALGSRPSAEVEAELLQPHQ